MYVFSTIVGQASVKFKKRPLKEKENQNVVRIVLLKLKFDLYLNMQNTGSTSATGTTGTAHNASGMLMHVVSLPCIRDGVL